MTLSPPLSFIYPPQMTTGLATTVVLTGFTAPFDKNGVLYYLGTNGGLEAYQNPHLIGAVTGRWWLAEQSRAVQTVSPFNTSCQPITLIHPNNTPNPSFFVSYLVLPCLVVVSIDEFNIQRQCTQCRGAKTIHHAQLLQ